MTYQLYLTALGATKIATAATAGGKAIHITEFAVGQGVDVDFTQRLDKQTLVSKRYQGAVSAVSQVVNQLNQYEVACIVPQDVGGWFIREVGLIDSDGDLIWVGNLPEVQKPDGNSLAAVDYRINCMVSIDNYSGAVTLVVDGNVITATRKWVDLNFIPRTALEFLYPYGYKYWSHINQNPKPFFDMLFGKETFWRRLQGVELVAVQDTDAYINQPMQYLGQKGLTDTAIATRPHAYPLYTSYLFERYDPAMVINTVWRVTADKQPVPEGEAVRLTITANNIPDGQILNWTITEGDGTTLDNSATGTVILKNGEAVINYQTTADDHLEDPNKTIHLTVSAPADLDLIIPITDQGHNETVIHISQSTYDGIVLDEYFKSQAGHYPTATDTVRFIIDAGVDIVAPSTLRGAIEDGTHWEAGSKIIIENHGRILGRGGNGGMGGYVLFMLIYSDGIIIRPPEDGQDGGLAVSVSQDITINNYGMIAGGGGGGGGGAFYLTDSANIAVNGASGGGGAPFGLRSPNSNTVEHYLEKEPSLNPKVNVYNHPAPIGLIATGFTIEHRLTTFSNQSPAYGAIVYRSLSPNNEGEYVGVPQFNQLNPDTYPLNETERNLIKNDIYQNKPETLSMARAFAMPIYDDESKTTYKLVYDKVNPILTAQCLQSQNATLSGTGGGGYHINNAVLDKPTIAHRYVILDTTSLDLSKNHGGDGGDYGKNGDNGVQQEFYSSQGVINQSDSQITNYIPPAQGGLAGYIYQGNITINNINGGMTKGRTP